MSLFDAHFVISSYMANAFASAQYLDLHAERCTSIADAADPLSYAPDSVSTYSTPFPSSMPSPYFANRSANEAAAAARAESAMRSMPVGLLTSPRGGGSSSSGAGAVAVAAATGEEVPTMASTSASPVPTSSGAAATVDVATMRELLRANTRVGGLLDPFTATTAIIDECCRLCDCERATIFLINEQRRELEVRVARGAPQIFVPIGKGIAGTCAQIAEPILVPDAYADARFDRSHDAKSGFRTTNIIAVPITALDGDSGGGVVGVLQCINKHGGAAFTTADVFILQTLGTQACVTLRNAMLVDVAFAERRKSRALLDIVHSLNLSNRDGNGESNISSVSSQIFTVIQRTTDMVDSDRTTFFLVDHTKGELWSMQGSINLRFPMSKGLAGSVARTGVPINIADAYEDERFNRDTDRRTGYRTRSVLVLPMFGSRAAVAGSDAGGSGGSGGNSGGSAAESAHSATAIAEEDEGANEDDTVTTAKAHPTRPVIGVLQVINKKDGSAFDESDEEVLKMFLDITGPILEKSMLYQQLAKPAPVKEAARVFGGGRCG